MHQVIKRRRNKTEPVPGPIPAGTILYELLERLAEAIVVQHSQVPENRHSSGGTSRCGLARKLRINQEPS